MVKQVKTVKRKKATTSKGKSPESAMRRLIKEGALEKIGAMAIKESHDLGLSVTVMEDGVIYRLHPDGTRTIKESLPA